jgi:hypothetical protein
VLDGHGDLGLSALGAAFEPMRERALYGVEPALGQRASTTGLARRFMTVSE